MTLPLSLETFSFINTSRFFPPRAVLSTKTRDGQAFHLYQGEVEKRTCPLQVASQLEREPIRFRDLETDSLKGIPALRYHGRCLHFPVSASSSLKAPGVMYVRESEVDHEMLPEAHRPCLTARLTPPPVKSPCSSEVSWTFAFSLNPLLGATVRPLTNPWLQPHGPLMVLSLTAFSLSPKISSTSLLLHTDLLPGLSASFKPFGTALLCKCTHFHPLRSA